jgi:hypothetical protein
LRVNVQDAVRIMKRLEEENELTKHLKIKFLKGNWAGDEFENL